MLETTSSLSIARAVKLLTLSYLKPDVPETENIPEKVGKVKRSVQAEAGAQNPDRAFRFNKRASGNKRPRQFRAVSSSSNEIESSR